MINDKKKICTNWKKKKESKACYFLHVIATLIVNVWYLDQGLHDDGLHERKLRSDAWLFLRGLIGSVIKHVFLSHRVCTRQAVRDWSYRHLRAPAGMAVQVHIWAVHHDAKYWPQPELFDPDRYIGLGTYSQPATRYDIRNLSTHIAHFWYEFWINIIVVDKISINVIFNAVQHELKTRTRLKTVSREHHM